MLKYMVQKPQKLGLKGSVLYILPGPRYVKLGGQAWVAWGFVPPTVFR